MLTPKRNSTVLLIVRASCPSTNQCLSISALCIMRDASALDAPGSIRASQYVDRNGGLGCSQSRKKVGNVL
ncbi:hypothetical protein HBI56_035340 [Parastagonospora nodorum]|uniref:Uncharacterized protein n=1 Tax=Phaeosphaeria nodorum (strain SN15 / ATCC MYA-4574 / FGSC 10173) TaxID=321614 RepID=A0A7U2HXA3_PHANO|nr:hypothetical protein HBH56_071490 [Parastagonospora nodorum]QRC93764.1 hypothetical protein JI435_404380 [Parastagonospora nodorum SN15]KAH3932359.1 hypothetical protein HBH54_076640 [Parastagonospora nodorum]KAH3986499.1 hypothetical protein HBH52_048880 [Parastagonospora nodorum]KAH3988446.1 hypothetical protein HBH51_000230 [Parastagonospora nodorum]